MSDRVARDGVQYGDKRVFNPSGAVDVRGTVADSSLAVAEGRPEMPVAMFIHNGGSSMVRTRLSSVHRSRWFGSEPKENAMKRFMVVVTLLVLSSVACAALADDGIRTTWGDVKAKYVDGTQLTQQEVQRAAGIFRQEAPSQDDLEWLESMTPEQRQFLMKSVPAFRSIPNLSIMEFGKTVSPSAVAVAWDYEFIEKREGGGTGCYTTGFWNDNGMCGGEFPPDKVYRFPCSNRAAKDRMRIWSTNWRVRWALGSGVSARVYDGYVDICFGYWSLYFTGTNPYSVLSTTYIYW